MIAAEVAVLRRLAAELEEKANERASWLMGQTGFYIHYEDRGETSVGIRVLRETAENYRRQANALEKATP